MIHKHLNQLELSRVLRSMTGYEGDKCDFLYYITHITENFSVRTGLVRGTACYIEYVYGSHLYLQLNKKKKKKKSLFSCSKGNIKFFFRVQKKVSFKEIIFGKSNKPNLLDLYHQYG